ncbi:MAG: cation transporter [Ignavibacteria bacterium]|nr:cation transporter [Ignavibacteria bacterium]
MKKIIFAIIFTAFFITSIKAQVSSLVIGVDGFTCSLCAKGVEEQFKSLDYVKSVKTDLKKTEFTLTFKKNPKVELSQIKDAVNDGGFSVRDIRVVAKGSIKGSESTGYYLITPNANKISLKGVNGNFSEGDKVSVKGKVNNEITFINVTSIKKM